MFKKFALGKIFKPDLYEYTSQFNQCNINLSLFMSNISNLAGRSVEKNALQIDLTLDDNQVLSHTIFPSGESPNAKKSENIIKRLINPHFKGLLLKHIKHLDKLLSDILGEEQLHTGGFNISMAISHLFWQAYKNQNDLVTRDLLEEFEIKPSVSRSSTYIFSVIQSSLTSQSNLFSEFMIITKRNIEFDCAYKIFKKFNNNSYNVPISTNVDILEWLIAKIKESEYVLNQDIFIGIKADLKRDPKTQKFIVADSVEDYSDTKIIEYFKKIVDVYDPLIIENPITPFDQELYLNLENTLGKDTLIGLNFDYQNFPENNLKRILKNQGITVSFLDLSKLQSISQLLVLSSLCRQHKVKLALILDHSNSHFLSEIISLINPEFIKLKVNNNHETI